MFNNIKFNNIKFNNIKFNNIKFNNIKFNNIIKDIIYIQEYKSFENLKLFHFLKMTNKLK